MIVVTQGEPAGIGTEIILKAWAAHKAENLPGFAIIGDPQTIIAEAKRLDLDIDVKSFAPDNIGAIDAIAANSLPVIALSGQFRAKPGKPASQDGKLVIEAIKTAVNMCFAGQAAAMVTAPINKKALYDAGFDHPGHTEFLAALATQKTAQKITPVMMLAGPELRAIPVTIHIPLSEIPTRLDKALICRTVEIAHADLRRNFAISKPRIALAGLNPHAGEDGAMGSEENEIVIPAIEALRQKGISVVGPLPADTMFHATARKNYDVAICMYHDQALIPVKTLGFEDSVNATLGLPFIRTSPDHGTAFDIAGKGIASPDSLTAAIKMAGEMVKNRQRKKAEPA